MSEVSADRSGCAMESCFLGDSFVCGKFGEQFPLTHLSPTSSQQLKQKWMQDSEVYVVSSRSKRTLASKGFCVAAGKAMSAEMGMNAPLRLPNLRPANTSRSNHGKEAAGNSHRLLSPTRRSGLIWRLHQSSHWAEGLDFARSILLAVCQFWFCKKQPEPL